MATETPSVTTHTLEVGLRRKERSRVAIIEKYQAELSVVENEIAELHRSIIINKENELAALKSAALNKTQP